MFRLESTEALYLLLTVALLTLFFIWSERRQHIRLSAFGSAELIGRLMPEKSEKQVRWRYFIYVLSVFLIVLAASNPQWGVKSEKVKVEKADIFIALDISNSMNATDVSPSRLERAKKFAEKLIRRHKGNRIALIFFAGEAYLQMPITTDYAAALMFLRTANTAMAGTQGTDIDGALQVAAKSAADTRYQKALVIITDGEDHDSDALTTAERLKTEGFSIFTVGVGTEAGAYIPFSDQGIIRYKTDEEGNPVRTRINKEYLSALATAGNGAHYLINEGDIALADMDARLAGIRKNEMEIRSFTEFNSYYQYLLASSIILLFVSFFFTGIKAKNGKSLT
jgi:Ca-activated chloride channel homolog